MKRIHLRAVVLILIALTVYSFSMQAAMACGNDCDYLERSIDIGGYKLYIHSMGRGEPAVLCDSGQGDTSEVWNKVQLEISEKAKTVTYDRAGLGKSEASPYPRISSYMVMEWHKLLEKAKIKGPYILVGHSTGGFNVRLFAAMYPKEVAGLILVDPSHEEQDARLISVLPPEVQQEIKSQFSTEGTYEDFLKSAEQVRATRNCLRNIPLTVITATDHGLGEECEKIWMDMQNDIASLSNRSKHIIVYGSTHYIQNDRPKIVADAIKDMIKATSGGRNL